MIKNFLTDYCTSIVNKKNKNEKHYVVEKIVDHKKNKDGSYSYYVKWKGWDSKDNTWQKIEDFDGLTPIKKYWKCVGTSVKQTQATKKLHQRERRRKIKN